MKLFWKIAAPVACLAVVGAVAIIWQMHRMKVANERKLVEQANAWRLQAEQGDASAQDCLGDLYYRGIVVPQDYGEAARWFRKAADQNYAKAEDDLGWMYSRNLGVAQDYAEALRWYRKAADQGDAKAEDNLGFVYYEGRGVAQDYAQSIRWYRKAADQGYASAQSSVGYAYFYGQGVPRDRNEADRWYWKAADQGDEYAQRALGLKLGRNGKIGLVVTFLGSSLLLAGFRSKGKITQNRQQRFAAIAGLLGLIYVGLDILGFTYIGRLHSASAVDAFYLAKNLLAGTFVAMLILFVSGRRGVKIALGISGIVVIGFNVRFIAHYDLAHIAAAQRLFCSTNGMSIGLSVPLAIFLWRSRRVIASDEILHGEISTTETEPELRESRTDTDA